MDPKYDSGKSSGEIAGTTAQQQAEPAENTLLDGPQPITDADMIYNQSENATVDRKARSDDHHEEGWGFRIRHLLHLD